MRTLLFLILALGTMGFSQQVRWEEIEEFAPSDLSKEPPIYGLYTNERVYLNANKTVLHPFLLQDPSIITEKGKKFFTHQDGGLVINQPGLYKVSFFQQAYPSGAQSQLWVTVNLFSSLWGGYTQLRSYEVNLADKKGTAVQFTHIFRANKGDRLQLSFKAYGGNAFLFEGASTSGLIIEAIRSE